MNQKKAKELWYESMRVLRENQHPNGGFYASPPGTRYPYIYTRDHSVIILGALEANMIDEAERALRFILPVQKPSGEYSQRYDVDGNDASYKDLQIDGNGLVLYATGKYFQLTRDEDLCREYWWAIKKSVEFILKHKNDEIDLIHTVNSIHEYPAFEHGFEIYANSACCAGILEAVKIGEAIGEDVDNWKEEAEKIRASIFKRLYSPRLRSFIKTIRIRDRHSEPLGYDPFASTVTDPDAVEYAPAYFGLIRDDDIKVINTVKRIHDNLWDEELDGLNRYPESWDRNNGGYGPWPHFTCQLARHYCEVGNEDMAEQYLGWCVEIAHDYRFPEHISTIERFEEWLESYQNAKILQDSKIVMIEGIKSHPKWNDGLAYVTTPLIWPHAEYLMAYKRYSMNFL
ncbi:MAG TPA: glucoamylase [Candidatus Syntrophoarchaeum butanivorans]|uniref:Glucoamylase n=1 Tax=Candidatus Syntropharchaeum butanivorans TaxID=1839936 RepID=A0A7J2RZA7_9EURY|nr:glucoamylase [Candidatus Syntrophoarchaeum butanivorans]